MAVEEPLELRLHTPDGPLPLGILMRTPGHDQELLLGWLISEGLLPTRFTLEADPENPNVWHLHTPEHARLAAGARLAVSSSACGVCGKTSIEAITTHRPYAVDTDPVRLSPAVVAGLPDVLRTQQKVFDKTGGLHAAGLFTPEGEALVVREDVGRHNAVDKVIGWAGREDRLPLAGHVLVVSGRASFELVQKAVMAGIPALVAVSAPSSLAVGLAREAGLTLVGFARAPRLTVYSGEHRLDLD